MPDDSLERLVQKIREEIPEDQIVDCLSKNSTVVELARFALAIQLGESVTKIISYPTILGVFLYQLRAESIPRTITPATSSPHDPSEKAMEAWGGVMALSSRVNITDPSLSALIVEALPGMVKWADYLRRQRMKTANADDLCTIVCETLHWFSFKQNLSQVVRKTKGIHKLAVQYWLTCPPSSVDTCAKFLQGISPECGWDEFDEMAEAAKDRDQPVEIVDIAMKRLRENLSKNPLDLDSLAYASNVTSALMRLPGHYFTRSFLDRKIVLVFTVMLTRMAQILDAKALDEKNAIHCASICLAALRHALVRSVGFPYIREALKAGLLQSFCALAKHFDKFESFPKQCMQHIIRDTLTRGLVIGSVVKLMSENLMACDKDGRDQVIKESFLLYDWGTLITATAMRAVLLDMTPKEKESDRPCAWEECKTIRSMKELKRCGGCLVAYYCSTECQRKHWKHGHKNYCKLKKQERNENVGESMMFTQSDVQFIRQLSQADARAHLPHLEALARKKFPNVPTYDHVICIDYTDPERPMGVCSLKNIHTYKFDDTDEDYPIRAAQNNELINMVRANPKMHTFVEAAFMLGEQVVRRNVIISPNMFGSGARLVDTPGKLRAGRCPNKTDGEDLSTLMSMLQSM